MFSDSFLSWGCGGVMFSGRKSAGHSGPGPQVCVCGAGDGHLRLSEGHPESAQRLLHL